MNNEYKNISLKCFQAKRWKKIVVLAFAIALLILPLDAKQQKQYSDLRDAYQLMDLGQYRCALETFNVYINSHMPIYWKLQNIINGNNSRYSFEGIEMAISTCENQINRIEE